MSTICSTVRFNEPCLGEKTLKTSMITTSARNWNVLLERRERQHRRHFHQLFRRLRTTPVHKALLDSVQRDLGHCDNLYGGHSVEPLHEFHQLVPQLRHRHIENLHEGAVVVAGGSQGPPRPPGSAQQTWQEENLEDSSPLQKFRQPPPHPPIDLRCPKDVINC